MVVQASYDMRARQQLSLTPRLQQSVKLLQMSALEFTQELQHALASNPFLEEEEDAGTEHEGDINTSGQEAGPLTELPAESAPVHDEAPYSATDDSSLTPDLGSYASDYAGERHNSSDDEARDIGEWTNAALDLRDHLRHELCGYRLNIRDRALAEVIIEALDDDGYLRQEFDELSNVLDFDPEPSSEEWMVALTLVQQLDGPGIGARNLPECLRLQLDAMAAETPGRNLARRIVTEHLNLMARRETAEMKRKFNCDEATLTTACKLIRSLDPKPGARFSRQETDHVIPDVIVRKVKGRWVIVTNPAVMPRARLHHAYANLFRRARCGDRAPMAQELQEARWLMKNVEQRFTTIQRVAEAIVAHQRTFFDYGEIALKPLVLRKVAEELNLHESTVSRATGNKYMATPRGVFDFKHFFSRELATDTGGKCSAAAVRALLKDMIAAENHDDPLSDVSLQKMLADQGVVVARRTVTKYRGLMKVPPAELRKQL